MLVGQRRHLRRRWQPAATTGGVPAGRPRRDGLRHSLRLRSLRAIRGTGIAAFMNDQIQRELQARIEAFASDVTTILQKAVADAVAAVLAATEGSSVGRTTRLGPGKQVASRSPKGSKSAQKKRVTKSSPPTKKTARRAGTGAPFDAQALLREVERKPDQRMEELAKALRTTTQRLGEPMKTLLAAKAVKKAGQARGTTYRASQAMAPSADTPSAEASAPAAME